MTQTNTVPVALLRALLLLDAEAGLLTWRPRLAEHFTSTPGRSAEHAAANWNSRFAGTAALASPHINGYLSGHLQGTALLAHRVVWAMHYGQWPFNGLDHINGVRTDNRIINLRPADHTTNAQNMKLMSNNKTGIVGVSYNAKRGKYYASIRVRGKTRNLGLFDDIECAKVARRSAEIEHGFHPNHGRKSHAA